MKVVIIVQARMASQRLPAKVLLRVQNKPLLGYQIDSLKKVQAADEIVIATSDLLHDDPIESLCRSMEVPCFRGDPQDVLKRFYRAATEHQADVVVRCCADCPLLDPQVPEKVIHTFLEAHPTYDYVSNVIERSYPRGQDTECFSYQALEKAYREAETHREREHVTLFFYEHPQLFKLKNVSSPEDLSSHRWTVDQKEDFWVVKAVIEALLERQLEISIPNVLTVLKDHPEWIKLNEGVEQRIV